MINRKPKIEFTTEPHLFDVIPHPKPARKVIPDWYKRLANFYTGDNGFSERTIKRCPPVLDTLTTGWIIGTPADIDLIISDDGSAIEWRSDFIEPVLEEHPQAQFTGHPNQPQPGMKFRNYWNIKTPPGWSTLFVPPLNRPRGPVEAIPGIVETDKYYEYINFPSFFTGNHGTTFTLPRDYPLIQAIPFKRGFEPKAVIRAANQKDLKRMKLTRDKRSSKLSLYRDTMWERK
jgi:hypothetical protein